MATFGEMQQTMTDTAAALVTLNTAIEDLAVRIQSLGVGDVMTQAQLDDLNAQAQLALSTVQDAGTRVGALASPVQPVSAFVP